MQPHDFCNQHFRSFFVALTSLFAFPYIARSPSRTGQHLSFSFWRLTAIFTRLARFNHDLWAWSGWSTAAQIVESPKADQWRRQRWRRRCGASSLSLVVFFFCPNSESDGRRSSGAFCFDRRGVDHHQLPALSKSRSLPPLVCNRRRFINHWRIRCLWVIDAPVKRRACKIINPLFRSALFATAQPTPKYIPPLLCLRLARISLFGNNRGTLKRKLCGSNEFFFSPRELIWWKRTRWKS